MAHLRSSNNGERIAQDLHTAARRPDHRLDIVVGPARPCAVLGTPAGGHPLVFDNGNHDQDVHTLSWRTSRGTGSGGTVGWFGDQVFDAAFEDAFDEDDGELRCCVCCVDPWLDTAVFVDDVGGLHGGAAARRYRDGAAGRCVHD